MVGGQALLLSELSIEQLNTSVLQQLSIIEGLELASKSVYTLKSLGGAVIGVDIVAGRIYESTGISKKLQIDNFSFLSMF